MSCSIQNHYSVCLSACETGPLDPLEVTYLRSVRQSMAFWFAGFCSGVLVSASSALVLLWAVVQAPSLGLARVLCEREAGRHSQLTRPRMRGAIPRADFTYGTIRSTPVRGLRNCSPCFGRLLKASMVGFTLVSRSYYYLSTRSPAPPFPPDHRQAGEPGTGGNLHTFQQIYL